MDTWRTYPVVLWLLPAVAACSWPASVQFVGHCDTPAAWYLDRDGDGFGVDEAALAACAAPPGYAARGGDCDDADADVFPDALEVCDGLDTNCNGAVDDDPWWEGATAPVRVVAGAEAVVVDAPSVAIELDLADWEAALGADVDPGLLRAVLLDCALGVTELPAQWVPGVLGLASGRAHRDAAVSEGTLVALYDLDGDDDTYEAPAADLRIGVHLGADTRQALSGGDVEVGETFLANRATMARFDPVRGGLLSSLELEDTPSLTSQVDACCGNAVFGLQAHGWVGPQHGPGELEILAEGPLFGALVASGERSVSDGQAEVAFAYEHLYWLFARRPELHGSVHQIALVDFATEHGGDPRRGFRPWQSRQDHFADADASRFADPLGTWAAVHDEELGLAVAYRSPPSHPWIVANPPWGELGPVYDNLYLTGNDATADGAASIAQGTAYFDRVGLLVRGFEGTWMEVQDEVFAVADGAAPTVGEVEVVAW